jgi:hypothetical protein
MENRILRPLPAQTNQSLIKMKDLIRRAASILVIMAVIQFEGSRSSLTDASMRGEEDFSVSKYASTWIGRK